VSGRLAVGAGKAAELRRIGGNFGQTPAVDGFHCRDTRRIAASQQVDGPARGSGGCVAQIGHQLDGSGRARVALAEVCVTRHAQPMVQRFAALIFDLDDTLWEVAPVIVRAEHAMYRFLAQHYPRVTQRHDLHSMRDRRAAMVAAHPHMRHDFTWLRLQALREHAAEAGYDVAMADAAFEVFYAARNAVQLYPDVLPALQMLRRKYRLFALSNGNADLERIGLGSISSAMSLHAPRAH
jgi:hypothetical protein